MIYVCRLQDKASTYAGPMDVVKTIIKKEGVLGKNGFCKSVLRISV